MRRTQLNFDVQGSDHSQLVEKAQMVYRQYTMNPSAELPPATVMEVRSLEWDSSGLVLRWEGSVTVAITA